MYRAYSTLLRPTIKTLNQVGLKSRGLVSSAATIHSNNNGEVVSVSVLNGNSNTVNNTTNSTQESSFIRTYSKKSKKDDGKSKKQDQEDDDSTASDESYDDDGDADEFEKEEVEFEDDNELQHTEEELNQLREAQKARFLEMFKSNDLRINKDYVAEKAKEEEIISSDIDEMLATLTMKDLKIMRWTGEEEFYASEKNYRTKMSEFFVPEETTEHILKQIRQKEAEELAGSKFNSIKINYDQLSETKTNHIAQILNAYKNKYEKPLVQLYKDVTERANIKHKMENSEKKRLAKLKVQKTVQKKLSNLERQYRDLIHVKSALTHNRLNKSRLNEEHIDEMWNRMLERSRIMDPYNLVREAMTDEYNDLGDDFEFTQAYVTQLAFQQFDFFNPRSYNSLVEFYNRMIDNIDDDVFATPLQDLTPNQIKLQGEIEQLRQLGLELTPEELKKVVTEKVEAGQPLHTPYNPDYSLTEEETKRLQNIDVQLRHELDLVLNSISRKVDIGSSYRVVKSVTDTSSPQEALNTTQYALDGIAYNEENIKITDPPERVSITKVNPRVHELNTEMNQLRQKHTQFMAFRRNTEEIDKRMLAIRDEILQIEKAEAEASNQSISPEVDAYIEKLDSIINEGETPAATNATTEGEQELQLNAQSAEVVADEKQQLQEVIKTENIEQEPELHMPEEKAAQERADLGEIKEGEYDPLETYKLATKTEVDLNIPLYIEELPDFRRLADDLVTQQEKDVAIVAAKFAGAPVNEMTATQVLEELHGMHLKNNIFNERVIKHDKDVMRDAFGDVHIPTDVSFHTNATNRDLVDSDIIFGMAPKDTDLVRMLSMQLADFGLLNKDYIMREAPDNVPIPRGVVENNPDHFPDILENIDEAKYLREEWQLQDEKKKKQLEESTNAATTNEDGTTTITVNNNNNQNNEFNESDIYDPKRLYTNLLPIFKDQGVISLPWKKRAGRRVAQDQYIRTLRNADGRLKTEEELAEERRYRKEYRSHDTWLMGRPFDISKMRLNGQTGDLPLDIFDENDEVVDDINADVFNEEAELYRYFQEGKGEEWFGPEKIGDAIINKLDRRMSWYPREHLPTYPVQFIASHNTQDQTKKDFWDNRKVIMRVNVAALELPPVVEERLAELTKARFDSRKRILKLVASNHSSQDENKYQCKVLFKNLLHEAYMADPNFVSVRSDDYQGEEPTPSHFVPSKSAQKMSRFNLFRLTGFPTFQESITKSKLMDQLKAKVDL